MKGAIALVSSGRSIILHMSNVNSVLENPFGLEVRNRYVTGH